MESLNSDRAPNESNEQISDLERRLSAFLPVSDILKILGDDSFLIGGYVRDMALDKIIAHSDLDIMTRLSREHVVANLEANGYSLSSERLYENGKYSFNSDQTVVEFVVGGRKIQAGFIGTVSPEILASQGDLTMNCCAFSLDSLKIVTPDYLKDIRQKNLRFCSPADARHDPWKILSALKQISRIPDIDVDSETLGIIKKGLPGLVDFFYEHPNEVEELQRIFGNINSLEVQDLFGDIDTKGIFDRIHLIKPKLQTSPQYVSISVEQLDQDRRDEIIELAKRSYGRRLELSKLFNDKINSVVYGIGIDGKIDACCMLSGERIYAIASSSSESIVSLVHDLCVNNYSVFASVSTSSRHIISLAKKAGLKMVDNTRVIEKVMVGTNPEYRGRMSIAKKGDLTTFSKVDSDDGAQVLLLS